MFFNGWLQRKLASVLRPWLRQDSELEVKLGFLRSHGIAKNLCFDTDVLTQQLDDSARFACTDFRIDELKLGVSNWSFPAFRIDVDGLHVTLALREIKDEDRANQRGQTVDTCTEDMKKVLSKIDPEGIALNDAMESLSAIICSYNRKTSILCTILGHCHLRIRRVHLLVQCPTSNHPYSCILEMNDFDIKSGFTVHRYFLKAVISSLLLPSAENSFELGVKGFTVGLKDKDSINNIFSSKYLQTSIALKDLRLVKFNLSNPKLELTISPSQISIITAMSKLSTTESNCARNGRQLWSIAASRYNSLLPARRWSFHKVVNVVCLWLRYVHAYEHLLLSIGYPVDEMLNRSVIMMSHDKQFSISVKRKWNEISTFEKDLPLEAAVLARRLVRCRVSSSVNQFKDISVESLDIRHTSFIWKILNLLVTVWSYICSTCYSIILLALRQSHYVDHLNNNGQGIASNAACLQHCFSVNIGIISITICPEKAVERSVSGRAKSDIGISYSNLLSFCFSVDTFYFLYKEYIFDRFLSFSCGNVNGMSSSVIIDSLNNYDSHLKGRKKKYSDPVLTLWGQPAQVFDYVDANSFPFVGGQLKEMWSTWKTSCAELENGKVLFPEHPFILCEIKDFLTDQGFSDKSFGFKNCCLVIGELNVILDYASIVSVVLILKQIQSALYRSDCSLEANFPLDTPVTCEDPLPRSWDNKYNSRASEMEMQLYKSLPHQHIQAAVFVAGTQIRISLNKEGFFVDEAHVNSMHDEIHLVFNMRSVELGVKPTLGSDLESSSWGQSIQDEPPARPRLKEPELTCNYLSDEKICKCQARSTLDAHLKVNGLIAYLDTKNQQDEVIVLNPTTIRLSSIRKELHSFGATIVAFSAALHWITTELAVMIFTDEFSILVKVVDGLTSIFTSTTTFFDSYGFKNIDGSGREKMVQGHSGNTGTVVRRVNWGNLIESSTGFVINCTCEIKAMDIVLHKSRERNFKVHTADTLGKKRLTTHEVLDYGVIISIKESRIGISYMAKDADVLASFSVLRAGLFNSVNDVLGKSDKFCVSNVLQHSINFTKELSFSDCTFALWLRCLVGDSTCEHIQSLNDPSDCDGEVLNLVEESQMATDNEASVTLSPNTSHKFSGSGQSIAPASSLRILVNVSLSEIYFAGSAVKDLLFGEHNLNKLRFSLSIGENCRRISCLAQGGSIFLEAEAVAMFFQCLTSYEQCLRQVLPAAPLPKQNLRAGTVENVVVHNNHHSQGSQTTHQNVTHDKLAKLVISLSEISLVLMERDELGILQEILFALDVHLDVDMDERRKVLLRLSQFSIISHILYEGIEQQNSEIQISQSSSDVSNHPSSLTVIGNTTEAIAEDPTIPITGGPTTAFQQMRGIPSALDEAGSSGHSLSPIESYTHPTRSKVSGLSPQNCILKHLSASLALEKFMSRDIRSQQYWVGGGSISGFEMTISLQEIQIILSMMEIMSGFPSKKQTNNIEQKYLTRNQEPERKFEDVVPDGAVVALQDVHHHMYITVEGGQNNYKVVGSIHYSVVGDRALFRVKYHYQRRWGSTVLWISLTSLYAKSDSGEPLRLNCRAGSSFVDISSSSDSVWALWKMYPFKAVNYYGDTEVDSYCPVATNMFHLINRKNDRGIAFVDDSLECMSKPGNPFKLKVFQDYVLAGDTYPVEALENGIKEGPERTESQTCISIEVDKCIVTIVHEISTTKEKIPLLQLSIVSQELLMQILHVKARIMSRLNVVLYYFDAQRNLWSELLHPAEISLYFRYRFQIAGIETILPTVPVHFYGKIKQLDISMTELSLDILLFVIGELNLAGPFAVRSSVILANCCKVENQSGLTLLCHFHQNQYASVARNQSSMVFLRHLALVSQTSNASGVTVQYTDQGSFTTSPIHISLLEDRTFAWRTRIVSSQEPKTYPGPFIVAEVSRRRGDGLSLAVSPLLRIRNETDFSMELRFQRPEHKESESASVILKAGDTIDDTLAAFSAINLSGGSKKALVSLSVGNYLFSFRPEITKDSRSLSKLHSVEWSNDLKGGKAIYLSGLFDKLGYKVRKALSTESVKCSFSIAHCSLKSEEGHIGDIDFLIQSIGRDIPVIQPDSTGYTSSNRNSHVALQEQKEIFILPTIQISNLLQTEVEVFLSDKDSQNTISRDKIGKFAIVPCKSTSNLYANPATIYFTFTLTTYNSSCKPVNCADWVKKLQKQKSDVNSLDIELDFGSGKYFAFLRLAFKDNGILEAAIFTPYTLKNETEFLLFCCGPNQKPLARYEAGNLDSEIPPELGSFLPAKSTSSWFIKCNKVRLILLDKNESHTILDLDALSGLTEIDLEVEGHGCNFITKLGVSLKPSTGNVIVPSRTVSINPRYMVSNESEETIIVRQCYLEEEMQGVVSVNGKQRTAVHLRNVAGNKKEISVFDKILRHHKSSRDDSLLYVQFKPKDAGFDWSGPVCVTSLGRFFLKFKRLKDYPAQDISNHAATPDHEYSSVNVIEEDSTLVLHFYRPPHTSLPYRIENCLEDAPITYYQKGSSEPEVIGAGGNVDYVWDDSNLPHKLVIQISEVQLLREINLDKLRAWKPFYRAGKQRGLGLQLPLHRNPGDKRRSSSGQLNGIEIITSGFEVYADGPTRVLRICEFPDSHKSNTALYSGAKMQLRVFDSAISILEPSKKERDINELPTYTPIIVLRLGNIYMDSLLTNHRKCNSLRVESLSVDEKWIGAPFASMIRKHHSQYPDTDTSMLHVVFILLSTSSEVKHVEYSSIVLQPFDLNLDEETLMRIAPFWRTSLSDPHTKSQQYYFDHFEIHPIKIIASFLPGEFYSSYSSTQETLRSLLHSVIKIPAIKHKSVELNGVLVTHAMITIRELSIKCAQHYSWYAMRAIYIAKGSPLLPPAFASIFDDSASSSLDVFFDPSSGLINLPGLTIGTFKLISKSIDSKGFSGTKRYFGDLGKTLKAAGSNILFVAATEISDSILKGAETSGFNGMVSGFHQGVLKLAMEPTLLGTALIEGGPDRKIKLDRNPGVDELYIEGYLQAMLDAMYKQEYLRVRVIDDQVILKNLPPSSSLIEEIMDRVKGFLVSKTLLKGDSSSYRPLRHIRGESDWKIGPTILTLCEHLFVSFMIRGLRKQAGNFTTKIKLKEKLEVIDGKPIVAASVGQEQKGKGKVRWRLGIGRFVLSGLIAYLDGRLCRCIPNPIARRIVSGFLLTFLDQNDQ